MEKVISTLATMPAFLGELFSEHLVFSVLGVMIFLLALMVPGRIGSLIRKVVIIANVMFAMAGGFMGRSQNGYQIICLSAISLLLLLIIRTIVRIVSGLKQRRIDKRIEERALAKAAKRRGTLAKAQDKDSESELPEEDFVPPELSTVEIRKVIENEINEGRLRNEAVLAAFETTDEDSFIEDAQTEIAGTADTEMPSEETDAQDTSFDIVPDDNRASDEVITYGARQNLPKPEILNCSLYTRPGRIFYQSSGNAPDGGFRCALSCLAELHDKGILTDEEFLAEKEKLEATAIQKNESTSTD